MRPFCSLVIFTIVGTFEKFLMETTRHATLPSPEEIEKALVAHEMKVVGPPLEVD